MLQPRCVFAVLFKGYRDVLAVFVQSGSVPMLDARRAEHYVARTSGLYDSAPYRCKFYPTLRLNFAPRDACAMPCVLCVENAPAQPLHLHKASQKKVA